MFSAWLDWRYGLFGERPRSEVLFSLYHIKRVQPSNMIYDSVGLDHLATFISFLHCKPTFSSPFPLCSLCRVQSIPKEFCSPSSGVEDPHNLLGILHGRFVSFPHQLIGSIIYSYHVYMDSRTLGVLVSSWVILLGSLGRQHRNTCAYINSCVCAHIYE